MTHYDRETSDWDETKAGDKKKRTSQKGMSCIVTPRSSPQTTREDMDDTRFAGTWTRNGQRRKECTLSPESKMYHHVSQPVSQSVADKEQKTCEQLHTQKKTKRSEHLFHKAKVKTFPDTSRPDGTRQIQIPGNVYCHCHARRNYHCKPGPISLGHVKRGHLDKAGRANRQVGKTRRRRRRRRRQRQKQDKRKQDTTRHDDKTRRDKDKVVRVWNMVSAT
jgi:hypothetical protein